MLMTTLCRNGRREGENCERNDKSCMTIKKIPIMHLSHSTTLTDLESQTASEKTGLVHGAVLLHKPAAQVPVLLGEQLTVLVVVEEPLGEVDQGAQLTEGVAVRLNLGGVVVSPEEGTVVVGGDVTALLNDVQKARLQDLQT